MTTSSILSYVLLSTVIACASVSAETFYATPTLSSTPCTDILGNLQCQSLSWYTTTPNGFNSSTNISLILLPGLHNLTSDLIVQDITQFTMSVSDPSSETSVTCSDSVKLRFENINSEVRISGIRFVGCVGNSIISVEQCTIEDCNLQGQGRDGTGLNMKLVTNANITRTNFTSNTGNHVEYLFGNRIVSGGGALIVNYSTAFISGCNFDRNTAHFGGAVYSAHSNITIDNCILTNNVANSLGGATYTSFIVLNIQNSTFENNIAIFDKGYGGAMEIAVSNSGIIKNCSFNNNKAIFGGAIDLFNTSNIFVISDVRFIGNLAKSASTLYVESANLMGKSLLIKDNFAATSVMETLNSYVVVSGNTLIANNIGSVLTFVSNVTFSGNTTFVNNSHPSSSQLLEEGGALTCFQSYVYLLDTNIFMFNSARIGGAISAKETKVYMFGNVTISYNSAYSSGGGIFLYQSELNFLNGSIQIFNNLAKGKGGAIHAVSATTRVIDGFVLIAENSAERGGAMYLELNAKLYIAKYQAECVIGDICVKRNNNTWVRLELVDNSADYGGALYVADDTNAGNCNSIPFRKQSTAAECFFQSLALHSVIESHLNILNTFFVNNKARIAGDSLYGGLLDRCTVSAFAELFNVREYSNLTVVSIDAISYFLNTTNIQRSDLQTQLKSGPVRVCFCNNDKPDCSFRPPTYYTRRGKKFSIPLVAVDQVNNTVANSSLHGSLINQVSLRRGQSIQNTSVTCSNSELNYTIFSSRETEVLFLHANGPCDSSGISRVSINISFLSCPAGFKTSGTECDCDPILHPHFVSDCTINTGLVLRTDNVWVALVNDTVDKNYMYVTYSDCPFDYCRPGEDKVYVNLSVENGADEQCAFYRTGRLCGSCDHRNGLSHTFGGSSCLPCSNNWLALLIVFALAGIALVGFILLCNLTVAVGSIDALIFYANIVGANRATFLPFKRTNFLSIFIAWLNLDFGFETCFYDGLDEYAKMWLQFIFPIYIIVLVAIVIVISKYNRNFANLLSKRKPIATLATLILLSFTKLVRTVIAALSFGTLTIHVNNSTRTELVWLIDGNIPYLKGIHVPLFIVAVIVFFVALGYTMFLFFWQWLLRCPNRKLLRWIRDVRLNTIMDAYDAPLNRRHRYWTGLLLITRACLYLISALNVFGDPKVPLVAIVIVIVSLLLCKELVKGRIYKTRPLNVLEGIFMYNLIILASVTLYIRETTVNQITRQRALAYISTSVAFVIFVVILFYHIYTFILTSFKPFRKFTGSLKRKAYVHTQSFWESYKTHNNDSDSHVFDKSTDSERTKPLIDEEQESTDFSKFRGPLELIDSHSVAQNHQSAYIPPAKRNGVVTYSVVDAIPSENEQSVTLPEM